LECQEDEEEEEEEQEEEEEGQRQKSVKKKKQVLGYPHWMRSCSFNSLQLNCKIRRLTVRVNPNPKPCTNTNNNGDNNGDNDADTADAIYDFTCEDSENIHPNSLGNTRGRVRPSKKSEAVQLNPYKRTNSSKSNGDGVEGRKGREKEEKEETNKDKDIVPEPESLPQPAHVDDTYGRWIKQQCPAPLPSSTLSVFGTSDANTNDTGVAKVSITSDMHTIVSETASIDMSDILFTCIQQQDFHRLASLLEYPDAAACGTSSTMLELAEKGTLYMCMCALHMG